MARAEFVTANIATVELCSHFMCSCRRGFGDKEPQLLTIEHSDPTEAEIATSLHFTASDGTGNTVKIPGIASRYEIERAYAAEDGPVILGNGNIVCGAIDILMRKRNNG